MIGMRMVEREAGGQVGTDKNLVGDDENIGWFITWLLCLVSLLCLGDEQVISQFSIHVGESWRLENLDLETVATS